MKKNPNLELQEVIKKYLPHTNTDELNCIAKQTSEILLQYFQILNEISTKQQFKIQN